MASIFSTDPTYLTVAVAKESSTLLNGMTDAEVLKLIIQAEDRILNYLGVIITEEDRLLEIKKAVLYTAEHIISDDGTVIKSETTGDRSWTYEVARTHNYGLPKPALDILEGYRNVFYKQVI